MPLQIRPETPADASAIEAVTLAAFQKADYAVTEHFIVNALRQAGQLTVSLVAEDAGEVIGHVAVSPVTISSGAARWYGLGPISVVPARQGQGVGTALMKRALAELQALGAAGCVVLGNPAYYSRFGFQAQASLIFPGVPAQYFQAVAFGGSVPAGTVAYHESFNAQG
jgi:predicted N-acetyltransferase YhbS